jgi:hypothetical protein
VLASLAEDLASGRWDEQHGYVLRLESLDIGYRVVAVGIINTLATLGRLTSEHAHA